MPQMPHGSYAPDGVATSGHLVYCSRELNDINRSKTVDEYECLPLCVLLHSNHYTALMYTSSDKLEHFPVPYQRVY